MQRLVIILLVIGAVCAPPPPPPPLPITLPTPTGRPPPTPPPTLRTTPSTNQIIRQSKELNPDGSYQWSYESNNGISAEEKGQLQNAPGGSLEAADSFRYTSIDGVPIALSYVADENGFQPAGSHLPIALPIPPLIAKALQWTAAHPQLDN